MLNYGINRDDYYIDLHFTRELSDEELTIFDKTMKT
jgi:hypothetical protein